MTISSRSRRLVLALMIAATLPALAACSIGDTVQQTVNGVVQDATGGDVSLDGSLPKDWPAEVPLIDGEVLFATGGIGEGEVGGWVVTIKATSATPIEDARAQLLAAGFSVAVGVPGADSEVVTVTNTTYGVVVAGNADGILYTVTPLPDALK
ncbi:hypothetical protein [Cryobacterium sp. N21]|uniref:hypothetical protein n=1 Tax=Cryobacterium sp. N21 TaxID=2048289 RepID=UPI000CE431A1|nr:hypothetical protein [Cryobacterium sp. N21]